MKNRCLGIFLLVLAALCVTARANNIDLSTVPNRDSVQLTIYNSEDLTLVRETRKVVFKKGQNPLQFSWANTLIDPTSVELKFLTNPEKLEVLDTTFPRDKPEMLYWNVQSDLDGEATVEITYFTSGITWAADYVAIADKAEKQMQLDGYVRVTNHSGEEYENAQVRLVVGTINLVEKIAQLAHVPVTEVDELGVERQHVLRDRVAKDSMSLHGAVGGRDKFDADKAKEVIKEGLSEYFIYTIEGTETIPNGWSKRLRSFEGKDAPFKIQYRYRPREYGDQLVRLYLLTNDKASNLGTTPLPNGNLRIFVDNGHDGLSYRTTQAIKYVPIGDKIELNLGADPQVIFELIKLKVSRDNIWTHLDGANVFNWVEDGAVNIDVKATVAGWDEHELYTQRIRNYSPSAIDVEVRRSFDGDAVFRSSLKPFLHDYRTVQFSSSVAAVEKKDLLYELLTRQGHNSKQNNVMLENAEFKLPG